MNKESLIKKYSKTFTDLEKHDMKNTFHTTCDECHYTCGMGEPCSCSCHLPQVNLTDKPKPLLAKLIADVFGAKFGTKNRAELITRLQEIYLKL